MLAVLRITLFETPQGDRGKAPLKNGVFLCLLHIATQYIECDTLLYFPLKTPHNSGVVVFNGSLWKMPKVAKFFVRHGTDGVYLHRFTIGFYIDCQDDPSCWGTADKRSGNKFTQAQIDKMRPLLEMFQGSFIIEPS